MNTSIWTDAETEKSEQIWAEYQQQHDLSADIGKTAGIDPHSGRVWIGDSIQDVLSQRTAAGIDSLLFFERIGSKTYYRKGGRRLCDGIDQLADPRRVVTTEQSLSSNWGNGS